MSSSCCWKIFYLEHFYSLLYLCHLLLLEDILPEHFTHYCEDFTHYYLCHLLLLEDLLPRTFYTLLRRFYPLLLVSSAAVGRYFTSNILLIITKILLIITPVICCCWKIFYLEDFTHYSCHLLLLEDILP